MNTVKLQIQNQYTYCCIAVVFLYMNNELVERKIKNIISFKITPKKRKYLGINLTEVKDLSTENCKEVEFLATP